MTHFSVNVPVEFMILNEFLKLQIVLILTENPAEVFTPPTYNNTTMYPHQTGGYDGNVQSPYPPSQPMGFHQTNYPTQPGVTPYPTQSAVSGYPTQSETGPYSTQAGAYSQPPPYPTQQGVVQYPPQQQVNVVWMYKKH